MATIKKMISGIDLKIVSAVIAGVVSLIVSLITFWATRHKIKSERQKLERELERKLTEKLYDKRIEAYPKAFSITHGLLGYIIEDETVEKKQIQKICEALFQWAASDASFILSSKSLNGYYELRDKLLVQPANANRYSKEQRREMWSAKNKFRTALREDVKLLFREDEPYENQTND